MSDFNLPRSLTIVGVGSSFLSDHCNKGDGTVIGLFFGAQRCGPCRNITPKLSTQYLKMSSEGSFEIIFISFDESEHEALQYYKTMPWKMLSYSERNLANDLNIKYGINGRLPTLVLLDNTESIMTMNGCDALLSATSCDQLKRFCSIEKLNIHRHEGLQCSELYKSFPIHSYFSNCVKENNGNIINSLQLDGKIIGLYFSAHWCSPCRHFTPILSEIYKSLQLQGKNFEIIFISSDYDSDSADMYYSSMPWKMLLFDETRKRKELSKQFSIQGIPALILLDEQGQTITTNGRSIIMSTKFDDLKLLKLSTNKIQAKNKSVWTCCF